MKKFNTVFDEWQEYLRMVVPAEAGTAQIHETRQAFHAGAMAMLKLVVDLTELCGEDGDEGADQISKLTEELAAFVKGTVERKP